MKKLGKELLKIFKDCLTGSDNSTYDFVRVFTCTAIIVYFFNSFLAINEPWQPIQFSEGFGLILVAAGATIRVKGTE